jgi:DNA-binding transcriptional LysR family regulator
MTDRPGPIRFGYHGSLPAARAIVHAAGRRDDEVELSQYDLMDPFRSLRGGLLDVMIIKFEQCEKDLRYSAVLTTDPRAAVLGVGHPLAGRESIGLEELADFDSFRCPGTFPTDVWDQVVPPRTPAGRPIRRRHELVDLATMVDTITRTTAVHISLLSLADVAPPGTRVVPIHDLPPAPVGLAWLRDLEPGPVHDFVADAEAALVPRRFR